MIDQFSRTENLIGSEAITKLRLAHVAVFGIGGVGGYACEALARAGVGEFTLIDNDEVATTNLNRQIIATHKTIGQAKVDVMRDRILEINPKALVHSVKAFYLPENAEKFDLSVFTYIVDAIDTVSSKIDIAVRSDKLGIPLISCMGTGNKLDPTLFEVSDISKTSVCPLAKVIRKELRIRGISKLKVVYSKEEARKNLNINEEKSNKRAVPSSISFVPSVAGLIMAGEVIKDIAAVR